MSSTFDLCLIYDCPLVIFCGRYYSVVLCVVVLCSAIIIVSLLYVFLCSFLNELVESRVTKDPEERYLASVLRSTRASGVGRAQLPPSL